MGSFEAHEVVAYEIFNARSCMAADGRQRDGCLRFNRDMNRPVKPRTERVSLSMEMEGDVSLWVFAVASIPGLLLGLGGH
ncbi:MAG: hypothetical protein DMG48_07470 [Acidobacteria bacterium]|nr:MAG: hypothetical protein DMG48_07470 [Acidobacteriota bacterium]